MNTLLFALAISSDKIGGMEMFAAEMAHRLRARGDWTLTLCFERQPSGHVREFFLRVGNVTLEVLPNQAGMGVSGVKRFWRILRKHRPTVVLYSLGGVVRWWPLVGRLAGVRRIVYYDQTSRMSTHQYRAAAYIRLMVLPLSLSVCATNFVKTCSDREGIVSPKKSIVIYSAVDFARDHGAGRAFRERYRIPDDRIIVLQVSWLVPVKGIHIALRAAKETIAVREDIHFVFCGDGTGLEQYQGMAFEMGISDHVTWTGQIGDLPASGAFSAANIQIQCSQWHEAFCLAVAEGMRAGLPIIASRIGGLPELVADGINGYLFEPHDHVALAERILKLSSDADLRLRMGREGRERAFRNHNLATNVNTWIDLLLGASARA